MRGVEDEQLLDESEPEATHYQAKVVEVQGEFAAIGAREVSNGGRELEVLDGLKHGTRGSLGKPL